MVTMKYTDDQIFGIFDHKASGIQTYLEAEAAPTVEKGSDFQEKKAPQYKSITIGDDKVDIDLENDLVYINDELVTADSDTPKHIIDVLRKAVPQVIKGETVKEPKEVKEEVITEGELLKFGSYREFQKWLKDYNGKLSDKVKIMIDRTIYDTPHKVLSAYEEEGK
jgi:hypothetical protein